MNVSSRKGALNTPCVNTLFPIDVYYDVWTVSCPSMVEFGCILFTQSERNATLTMSDRGYLSDCNCHFVTNHFRSHFVATKMERKRLHRQTIVQRRRNVSFLVPPAIVQRTVPFACKRCLTCRVFHFYLMHSQIQWNLCKMVARLSSHLIITASYIVKSQVIKFDTFASL